MNIVDNGFSPIPKDEFGRYWKPNKNIPHYQRIMYNKLIEERKTEYKG